MVPRVDWNEAEGVSVSANGRKASESRLGFALLLKFFTDTGRFRRDRSQLANGAVKFARQLPVPAADLGSCDWAARTIERHPAQIRTVLGFRECTVADGDKLTGSLAGHVADA